MGVLETEYSEIRQIIRDIRQGKIDHETAALLLKAYNEGSKRIDQYIKVVALTINHGKSARQIVAKNIISDGVAIDLDNHDIEERIKCPEQGDQLISRENCLDYSGQEHCIDKCQKCEQFTISRKRVFQSPAPSVGGRVPAN